jgi:hypothetical protein
MYINYQGIMKKPLLVTWVKQAFSGEVEQWNWPYEVGG